MSTLTYLDANVLIAVARGDSDAYEAAMAIIDDEDRKFAASAFLRLELLPKPKHFKRQDEVAIYEAFFAGVTAWANDLDALVTDAEAKGERYGLSAMDACHVAAAIQVAADELVTAEKPSKPIHDVAEVRIVPLVAEAPATGASE